MNKRHKLYEINTRVFFSRYSQACGCGRIDEIPISFWDDLADSGIDLVWLMGVWKTSGELIDSCCFQSGLIQSYDRALRDWQNEDVIGSPYSIDSYEFNPALGGSDNFGHLRELLADRGMKLILDFIPNHFSAASAYLKQRPEVFLQGNIEQFNADPHTLFVSPFNPEIYFAHGRDPFFPAWTDTAQINYEHPGTRQFMIEQLKSIASHCDGVRCDMAMLVLGNVFHNTWGGLLRDLGSTKLDGEFWQEAIAAVKAEYPDFLFIAEAYWDLEWDLQQLGFDYTYDKRLLDRLRHAPVSSIKAHLNADMEYQEKLVRFVENHDEDRAMTNFGKDRGIAAGLLISTIPGMVLYHDGQFEGKKIKLPVQLGREPVEHVVQCCRDSYKKILEIGKNEIIERGTWELLETLPAWNGNIRYNEMFAWQWNYRQERLLIIINFSAVTSQCRVLLDMEGYPEAFNLVDLWNNMQYLRSAAEAQHQGLYVELGPWQFHIFKY